VRSGRSLDWWELNSSVQARVKPPVVLDPPTRPLFTGKSEALAFLWGTGLWVAEVVAIVVAMIVRSPISDKASVVLIVPAMIGVLLLFKVGVSASRRLYGVTWSFAVNQRLNSPAGVREAVRCVKAHD
jgi:hypothetical protein